MNEIVYSYATRKKLRLVMLIFERKINVRNLIYENQYRYNIDQKN